MHPRCSSRATDASLPASVGRRSLAALPDREPANDAAPLDRGAQGCSAPTISRRVRTTTEAESDGRSRTDQRFSSSTAGEICEAVRSKGFEVDEGTFGVPYVRRSATPRPVIADAYLPGPSERERRTDLANHWLQSTLPATAFVTRHGGPLDVRVTRRRDPRPLVMWRTRHLCERTLRMVVCWWSSLSRGEHPDTCGLSRPGVGLELKKRTQRRELAGTFYRC